MNKAHLDFAIQSTADHGAVNPIYHDACYSFRMLVSTKSNVPRLVFVMRQRSSVVGQPHLHFLCLGAR